MKSLKYLLPLTFTVTAFLSYAQVTQRNLLQQFSPQTVAASLIPQSKWKPFPNTPAEWRQLLPDSIIQFLIGAGDEALPKEFRSIPASVTIEYVRTGNRSHYESISFSKRKQLWDLVLAESIQGKGKYVDAIMNGIWSICEETFWGSTAHISGQKGGSGLPNAEDPIVDLFSAETASMLAWTDYFAGAALEKASSLIRPRIYYEVNRRVLQPMVTAKYGYLGIGNPNAKLNNWAPWVMSNYITAALLLEKDETRRADAIVRAMKVVDQYINGLGEDGSCDEGPGYWFAAGACVFDALNLLEDATGGKITIYQAPIIQKMASYIYKTHIGGQNFINVADAPAKLQPDGLMLFRLGKALNDQKMMGFGSWAYHSFLTAGNITGSGAISQWQCIRRLHNLGVIKECAAYTPAVPNVRDVWLADIQLMAARAGDNFYVATHGGHNAESHNHNDVGDFIVYAHGYPVIIDAGRGTYTARTFSKDRYKLWFNTSPYHNLPTVNGYEQLAGREFEATDPVYKVSDKEASLTMNIEHAYPKEAGLRTWRRTVKLDRKKGIEIDDAFEASAPLKSLTQSFMTTCNADLDTPGKISFELPDGRKTYLQYDAALWTAKKEKVELTTPEDEVFRSSWDGRDIWRILLVANKSLAKGQLKYMLY